MNTSYNITYPSFKELQQIIKDNPNIYFSDYLRSKEFTIDTFLIHRNLTEIYEAGFVCVSDDSATNANYNPYKHYDEYKDGNYILFRHRDFLTEQDKLSINHLPIINIKK